MNDTNLDSLLNAWESPEPSPALRNRMRAAIPPRPRRNWLSGISPRWAVAVLAGSVGILLAASFLQREPVISRFTGGLPGGIYLRSVMLVHPPLAQLKWFRLGTGFGGGISFWWYEPSRTYSGFRLLAEPAAGGQYRVSVQPLAPDSLDRLALFPIAQYRPVPLPEPPPSRIVKEGEPFDIDVLRVPGKDERIYERIVLSSKPLSLLDDDNSPEAREARERLIVLAAPQVFGTANSSQPPRDSTWVTAPGCMCPARVATSLPSDGPRTHAS
jgi:hypothetical protein